MSYKILLVVIFLIVTLGNPSLANSFNTLDWQWSKIEVIYSENTSSNTPSIAIDSEDNIHVVWSDDTDYSDSGGDKDIFYKQYKSSTQIWSSTEVISTESTGDSYVPVIAIDSKDNIQVVWTDFTDYNSSGPDIDIFYKNYNTITQLWSTTEVVSTESTLNSEHSAIAIDSEDTLHVVWHDSSDYGNEGSDRDIFYKYYNTTKIWPTTEVISTESDGNSFFPSITVDAKNNIHVAWYDGSDYKGASIDFDIFYKKLDQRSEEWTMTELISNESDGGSSHPSIEIDSQNNIHIVWSDYTDYSGTGTDEDIFYKMYNTTVQKWSTLDVISTESTLASRIPSIAFDSEDTMHIVWHDFTDYHGAGNDADIFYNSKIVNQVSWNGPEILTQNSGASYNVELTIDSSQQIHVIWDDETDYLGAGTNTDIFYTKFSGIPESPTLVVILPNPSNGITDLEWEDVFAATSYSVYRDVVPIHNIEGLNKIAQTTNSYYVDELESDGIFYYAITANNVVGSSEISNTVYVQVGILQGIETDEQTEVITETIIKSDDGFVDFPMSTQLIFISLTLIIFLKRRIRRN